MCSQQNYGSMVDFDWYMDVLTQLVRMSPAPRVIGSELESSASYGDATKADVTERIGDDTERRCKGFGHAGVGHQGVRHDLDAAQRRHTSRSHRYFGGY